MKIAADQKRNADERGRKLAEFFDIPLSETEFLRQAATQIFNVHKSLFFSKATYNHFLEFVFNKSNRIDALCNGPMSMASLQQTRRRRTA